MAALLHRLLGVPDDLLIANHLSSPPAPERLRAMVQERFTARADELEHPGFLTLLNVQEATMRRR